MARTKIQSDDATLPAYHHGDLRKALVEASQTIIDETGRWDFSLREVARRAGVSHNAPYRHFADKEALLAAVGARGFGTLNAETEAAASNLSDPVAVLRALGRAYVGFGLTHPALYRLMFGQGLPSANGLPRELREAIDTARQRLRDVVLWGGRTGAFTVDPDDEAEVTAAVVAAWSLVHGFTLLAVDGVVEREDVEGHSMDRWAAGAIDRFIAGLVRPVG